MLNLYSVQIDQIVIHKVGNKSRNESIFLSQKLLSLDDEATALLKEFFLKPFRQKDLNFHNFNNEFDPDFNELHQLSKDVFRSSRDFLYLSNKIARHLYDQAVHPHIKSGEVYVVRFSNILLNNEKVTALGVFKSEMKHDFLQFTESNQTLDLLIQAGVNINNLDKGCLIFDANQQTGFQVLSYDGNRYDTKYWLENFLGVQPTADSAWYTKKYLKFCKDFANDVVRPAEDKQQEVLFMNRAVNHFAKNDVFEESAFLNDTLQNPELLPEFKHFKAQFEDKYGLGGVTGFDISNVAVSEARKKLKSTITLDTNIQIKLDFINPESAEKFIEKGWDEERQMYYYLVYFNKESN